MLYNIDMKNSKTVMFIARLEIIMTALWAWPLYMGILFPLAFIVKGKDGVKMVWTKLWEITKSSWNGNVRISHNEA